MNFLAHIYLSGDHELVTLGNFIADGVKGQQYLKYPEEIQVGILLHREIDTFTDQHATFRKSTRRLHPKYHHYSGVIVDIFYDHFLARNWSDYSEISLEGYSLKFYKLLARNTDLLTDRAQSMMPYMIADNWLLSYASVTGIKKVLEGMNRRTGNRSGMDQAVEDLQLHYDDFEGEFRSFFEELVEFADHKLKTLTSSFI